MAALLRGALSLRTVSSGPTAPNPAAELRQLIMGFRGTQLVHVAAKLGLADHLRDGPQPASRLAEAVGAEPQALQRLLRAVASLGLFAETADGGFALTSTGQLLRSDVPGSLRSLAQGAAIEALQAIDRRTRR